MLRPPFTRLLAAALLTGAATTGRAAAPDPATVYAWYQGDGLARQDNITALIQVARSEKDPDLKKLAVSYIARSKSKEATDFMMEILNK